MEMHLKKNPNKSAKEELSSRLTTVNRTMWYWQQNRTNHSTKQQNPEIDPYMQSTDYQQKC